MDKMFDKKTIGLWFFHWAEHKSTISTIESVEQYQIACSSVHYYFELQISKLGSPNICPELGAWCKVDYYNPHRLELLE